MKTRVVLADDHTIVTAGLKALLERQLDVVATVEDGRAAVAAVKQLKPDVVILDISMPLLNGIEAGRQIRKSCPKVKIIFLTMHTDVTYVREAFEAGASGYVVKHSAAVDLFVAIREALKGCVYVSPAVTKDVVEAMFDRSRPEKKPSAGELSSRQREILQLVGEGRSAKEIAAILNLSPRTVEFHKQRLMQQLGLHTTAQLIQYAIRHGIVSN
jgi:DNA-binding NarL/FixJ family response regulator